MLTLLAAVALLQTPNSAATRADKDSDIKICQANMKLIAKAVVAYQKRTGGPYPVIANVATEIGPKGQLSTLKTVPACPNVYNRYCVVPTGSNFRVTCSDKSHGYWENGKIVKAKS